MLKTEQRNEKSLYIDKMSTREMLNLINEANYEAVKAVEYAIPSIEKACDAAAESIARGGRLIYIGAGTSGRLGVLDASECPPTFGVSPDTVIGIIAGGYKCLYSAAENEEDKDGVKDLKAYDITSVDTIVGISASGNAAYIISAIEYAKSMGCVTIGLTNNHGSLLDKTANISIVTDTGPEIITGSTRMKAGTAQKLVLNMLSTCAMIKTGKIYENLMINLKPSNIKLTNRVIGIVKEIKKCDDETAIALLDKNEWNIRKALEDNV